MGLQKILRSLVLAFLLLELAFLLRGGVLVLLVLGHEIVHVGLSLSELHLVHALAGVPVQERLAAEHAGELLRHTLEHLLDGGAVADEVDGHLETFRGDVADGGLDVVGDPFNEVGRVLVLNVEHLLINLLGGHATTEHGSGGEVAAVAGIGGAHHVLGVEHLLRQLGHSQGTVLLRATRRQRGKANHEEVETGEGNQVHGELAQVGVQLTGEAEGACDTAHNGRNEMVEVSKSWGGELQSAEADVVKSLVVDAKHFVCVLNKLVDGQGGVVRLNNGVGNLGRRNDGEGAHDAVGVLFADLGDEEGAHTGTSATTERVGQLEALKAVAALGLLAHDIKNGVDEFGTLGVVALSPVVTSSSLAEHEVVGAKDLTVGAGANGVHGAGLEIHEHSAGNIAPTGGFIKVNVDTLQLKIAVAVVGTSGVNTVLVADNLPELGSNLVSALASLNVNDFAHCFKCDECAESAIHKLLHLRLFYCRMDRAVSCSCTGAAPPHPTDGAAAAGCEEAAAVSAV
jgi:hypothetical protein